MIDYLISPEITGNHMTTIKALLWSETKN